MKIKQIYTYREQNFYIDPTDKFRMARVGVGLKAELEADEDPQAAQVDLDAKAQGLVNTQIEKASELFIDLKKKIAAAEEGMGATSPTAVGDGGPDV